MTPETQTAVATPATLTDFEAWSADPAPVTAPEPSEAALERPNTPNFAEEADAAAANETAEEAEVAATPEEETRIQKRIATLTRINSDLKKELAARTAPAKAAEVVPAAVVAAATEVAPVSADFDSYEAYVKALVSHERKLEKATEAREAAAKAASDAAAAQAAAWNERAAIARAKHADWDQVVMEAGATMPISQAMHNFIIESDVGPQLSYVLGKDPAELQRIAALTPSAARRALTVLEMPLLPDAAAPRAAAVSKAPRPVSTVDAASGVDAGKEPDPKDFSKWNKWKDRQDALNA